MTTTYSQLHKAADRLEDLADAAAAEQPGSIYASNVDAMLGGPTGELAAAFSPDTARAVAAVIRRATCMRVPPTEVYTLADLILGED